MKGNQVLCTAGKSWNEARSSGPAGMTQGEVDRILFSDGNRSCAQGQACPVPSRHLLKHVSATAFPQHLTVFGFSVQVKAASAVAG